jgi:hypothetical protein
MNDPDAVETGPEPFAAAVYGLIGLFLGSLKGELLVAALLPRHRFAR